MQKYITLVSFTEEGVKNLKNTCRRAKAFSEKVKKKGINIQQTFWTFGRYDIIHMFEAPNDEVAAAMSFTLGSLGNVRTETLRAFAIEEMTDIVADVHELQIDQGTLK
ncbi:MAG: GYD domain-containing protein [candidate division Zixibacteria bacterium]|nr:GYD domain-containing protein [candidate division Zixibacteria bacterium]